jgi:hypothetical protein
MHTRTWRRIMVVAAGLGLAGCAATPHPEVLVSPVPVARIELHQVDMTPVELVLIRDIPAGTELRLRQERRLRPVWVGIYEITSVTAGGGTEPLSLREVPSFEDIRGRWRDYERSGQLAVISSTVDLPAGTRLTVRGRRYEGVDPLRQRYAWRETRAWLEPVVADAAPAAPVSAPLIVRMAAGPVHALQAYRKADGRLVIQAFDAADNPAESSGLVYTITGEGAAPLRVAATPGGDVTEVALPAALRACATLQVADQSGRICRAGAEPRGLDKRPIYFGDIHTHTDFSDGDYPIEDAIAWSRHRIGLDFAGPGDHISQEGEFGGLTVEDYARFGRAVEDPGRFCRMPALETSCAGGHQLILARDFPTFVRVMADYVRKVGPGADAMDSAAYYAALAGILPPGRAMVAPTHPIGHASRWPVLPDPACVGAAEIIHGSRLHASHVADPDWPPPPGGAREESSIHHALAAGYRLAFLGNSDNHRPLPGQPMERLHGMTAVQAERLDTASVFDAIRARRTYTISGARIVADATLNGAPIGSEITVEPEQPRVFILMARGTAPIAEMQIIHCGVVRHTIPAPAGVHDVWVEWTDLPEANRARPEHEYYYVRIRQTDGHIAVLSPFWIRTPSEKQIRR